MTIAFGGMVPPESVSLTSGTPGSTTGSTTTSASGSTFIIAVRGYADAFTTVTDTFSNTYALLRKVQNTSDTDWLHLFCCQNGSGGASHKPIITVSSSAGYVFGLEEVTGAAASSVDVTSAGVFDTSSPFGDSVTSTNANDMIVGYFGSNGAATTVTYTPGAGFSTVTNGGFVTGTNGLSLGVASQTVSSTGTYNPAFTVSSGTRGPAITLALIQAAGGGAGVSISWIHI